VPKRRYQIEGQHGGDGVLGHVTGDFDLYGALRAAVPARLFDRLHALYRRLGASWRRVTLRDGALEVEGVRLFVADPAMAPSVVRRMRRGDYERAEVSLIRSVIRPGDVVLEIGAGTGFTSLLCAKIVGDRNVHAFECNPRLEAIAQRNMRLNGLNPGYTLALLDREAGERDFYVSTLFLGSSIYPIADSERITVRQLPANKVLAATGATVIVIDAEGFEVEFMRFADLSRVRAIIMERHPHLTGAAVVAEMDAHLVALGFVKHEAAGDQDVAAFVRPD
jgi:FkbM family methyltransferase